MRNCDSPTAVKRDSSLRTAILGVYTTMAYWNHPPPYPHSLVLLNAAPSGCEIVWLMANRRFALAVVLEIGIESKLYVTLYCRSATINAAFWQKRCSRSDVRSLLIVVDEMYSVLAMWGRVMKMGEWWAQLTTGRVQVYQLTFVSDNCNQKMIVFYL